MAIAGALLMAGGLLLMVSRARGRALWGCVEDRSTIVAFVERAHSIFQCVQYIFHAPDRVSTYFVSKFRGRPSTTVEVRNVLANTEGSDSDPIIKRFADEGFKVIDGKKNVISL